MRGANSLDCPIIIYFEINYVTQFPTKINLTPELPTFWAILDLSQIYVFVHTVPHLSVFN